MILAGAMAPAAALPEAPAAPSAAPVASLPAAAAETLAGAGTAMMPMDADLDDDTAALRRVAGGDKRGVRLLPLGDPGDLHALTLEAARSTLFPSLVPPRRTDVARAGADGRVYVAARRPAPRAPEPAPAASSPGPLPDAGLSPALPRAVVAERLRFRTSDPRTCVPEVPPSRFTDLEGALVHSSDATPAAGWGLAGPGGGAAGLRGAGHAGGAGFPWGPWGRGGLRPAAPPTGSQPPGRLPEAPATEELQVAASAPRSLPVTEDSGGPGERLGAAVRMTPGDEAPAAARPDGEDNGSILPMEDRAARSGGDADDDPGGAPREGSEGTPVFRERTPGKVVAGDTDTGEILVEEDRAAPSEGGAGDDPGGAARARSEGTPVFRERTPGEVVVDQPGPTDEGKVVLGDTGEILVEDRGEAPGNAGAPWSADPEGRVGLPAVADGPATPAPAPAAELPWEGPEPIAVAQAVREPGTLMLAGLGLALIAVRRSGRGDGR